MADIVTFPQDGPAPEDESMTVETDTFLMDEGLELLAAYRAIQDPEVRASVMRLVRTLSGNGSRGAVTR